MVFPALVKPHQTVCFFKYASFDFFKARRFFIVAALNKFQLESGQLFTFASIHTQ
jgi:hypothetical protein